MSRRDTIIIAVLVNAGLLMILFATAMHTDREKEGRLPAIASVIDVQTPGAMAPGSFQLPPDEVDRALSKQSAKPAPQQVILELGSPVTTAAGTSPDQGKPGEQQYTQVVVRRGDYLERIARAHGTTVEKIMAVNNLSSGRLSVGQVLKIPSAEIALQEATQPSTQQSQTATTRSTPAASKKEVATSGTDPSSAAYYTVKSGDTPWHIASKNGIKLDDLLRLNNLDESKARQLKPGDQLRIR